MEILKIDNYTPWQATERRRLIAELEKQKRYYMAACKPYIDAMVAIENRHSPRYVMLPDADR